MKNNIFKMRGRGAAQVWRDGKLIAERRDNNMILDAFYSRLASNPPIGGLNVVCKVGTGSSPTVATMTALEAKATLVSGNWPLLSDQRGNVASLSQDGTKLQASLPLSFVFPQGQVVANLTEYGIDISYDASAASANVQTRVLTKDELGNPTALPVTDKDQLVINYTIDLEADVDQPSYPLDLKDQLGNVISSHTLQMRWGALREFVYYLNHFGVPSATPGQRFGHYVTKADNFVSQAFDQDDNAPGNITAETIDNTFVMTLSSGLTSGNFSEGINCVTPTYSGAPAGAPAWWRIHIEPPIVKTSSGALELKVERPLDGVITVPGGETPTDPVTYSLNLWAYPYSDSGVDYWNRLFAIEAASIPTWENEELQVGIAVVADNTDDWTSYPLSYGSGNSMTATMPAGTPTAFWQATFAMGLYKKVLRDPANDDAISNYNIFVTLTQGAVVKRYQLKPRYVSEGSPVLDPTNPVIVWDLDANAEETFMDSPTETYYLYTGQQMWLYFYPYVLADVAGMTFGNVYNPNWGEDAATTGSINFKVEAVDSTGTYPTITSEMTLTVAQEA